MYSELLEHPAQAVVLRMLGSNNTGFIADSIGQNSGIDFPDKAKMLCQLNPVKRMEMAVKLLRREVEMLTLESQIQEKTRANIDQNQRALLSALQPYLTQQRLQKLEKAMRSARLAGAASSLLPNGIPFLSGR